jgi:hypothetical protein
VWNRLDDGLCVTDWVYSTSARGQLCKWWSPPALFAKARAVFTMVGKGVSYATGGLLPLSSLRSGGLYDGGQRGKL